MAQELDSVNFRRCVDMDVHGGWGDYTEVTLY